MGRRLEASCPGFALQSGPVLPPHHLAAWSSATGPAPSGRPVILVVHALTGAPEVDEWWGPLVGPGRALDTERHELLCFNNLGSCYGSFGPTEPQFPRTEQAPFAAQGKGAFSHDPRGPAALSTWDQAQSILHGLDALGVDEVAFVTGGSLGGMIAWCLLMLAPKRFHRAALIACCPKSTPWIQGWNHIGRMSILADPAFPFSARGLELARQIAHMTYRAPAGLAERHEGPTVPPQPGGAMTYLEHQGTKLRARFHPLAYLAQLSAMDHHDVFTPPRSTKDSAWNLSRVRARTTLVGIDSDQLYPATPLRDWTNQLPESAYREVSSSHGHDAFLIEWNQMETILLEAQSR
ncbi:MAG: alpha/beta fold hydrolase [Myxococcota bacterium]